MSLDGALIQKLYKTSEQFCIVFNSLEHSPYLDLTYALFKTVEGHHQWRWMEH